MPKTVIQNILIIINIYKKKKGQDRSGLFDVDDPGWYGVDEPGWFDVDDSGWYGDDEPGCVEDGCDWDEEPP